MHSSEIHRLLVAVKLMVLENGRKTKNKIYFNQQIVGNVNKALQFFVHVLLFMFY